ncbi:indolepyruvate ferredoxin oxidreductase, alpha/beta subunit [Desulfocapsa sulfexigens DSM 10523]|uniref:Indolepyruvate ferredoxin oxidreductase, alpha/beta subunit n=1 Tax=Desulfocapsa sulfexigens (strain DSM 10523 / SB164P1) TaxID=1167006 RepID=M1PBP2_DESSD|nr:4Fe-4S dicluster domain-containing protein [Desulfocapsa sulfexigens]AGF77190.1 indolepyruvate ferredoxin oxidreductase, alpha/beta subunit [Desulfocapsa sulfexigens DSM 10523]
MWHISIEEEKCTGCNECVEGCPGEVYELIYDKATVVNGEECHGCFTCVELCDEDAITVEDR